MENHGQRKFRLQALSASAATIHFTPISAIWYFDLLILTKDKYVFKCL